MSLDEALERLLEQADADPSVVLSEHEAEAMVRDVWSERVAELADGRPGDDVRVAAAFQAGDQVRASKAQGLACFHGQDAEGLAVSPAELYIGFDGVSGQDGDLVAVGRPIEGAPTAQGLRVEWDGTAATRLEVVQVDRREPLPGTESVAPSEPPEPGSSTRLRRRRDAP